MNANRLSYLIQRHLAKTATGEEREELFATVNGDRSSEEWQEELEMVWNDFVPRDSLTPDRDKVIFQQIARATFEDIPAIKKEQHVNFFRTGWFRYAAMLLLLAGTATYLYFTRQSQKEVLPEGHSGAQLIKPGGNRATLTLADGSTILLDDAVPGRLAEQGNTKIVKLSAGVLAYRGNNVEGSVGYNTISTPKGGQYQISLPDGTMVWLNAASSIRFPTAFSKERRVSATGEVYVEVAEDKSMPFFLSAGGMEVQVLGTSFNVNAYENEPWFSTTLKTGSVRVVQVPLYPGTSPGEMVTIKAGEQAQLMNTGHGTEKKMRKGLRVVEHPDLDKLLAWKNGIFNFNDASLEEVMKQLERWYDIEVVYEKKIPDIHFVGELSRDLSLDGLLRALESSEVHFRVAGRKLIVMQ